MNGLTQEVINGLYGNNGAFVWFKDIWEGGQADGLRGKGRNFQINKMKMGKIQF